MRFEDVIGQEEVKRILMSEADGGRLPHALLLTGPEGCGKMPMALALAQYLCCTRKGITDGQVSMFDEPSAGSDSACGTCISCRQWEQLAHPDVHFMFPIIANKARKKEICDDWMPAWREMLLKNPYFTYTDWIQQMEVENSQPVIYSRESDVIQRKLSLKSVQGGWRIVIIWLPEKMQEACANKMLKLLEEPPMQTAFILVSEEPLKMLGTILSRVQRINMPRLKDEEISEAQCMAEYLEQKGIAKERIFREETSVSTRENLTNAKAILEREELGYQVTIVTDGFHQYRAHLIAKDCGLANDAVSAKTPWYLAPSYWVREWMAVCAFFIFG